MTNASPMKTGRRKNNSHSIIAPVAEFATVEMTRGSHIKFHRGVMRHPARRPRNACIWPVHAWRSPHIPGRSATSVVGTLPPPSLRHVGAPFRRLTICFAAPHEYASPLGLSDIPTTVLCKNYTILPDFFRSPCFRVGLGARGDPDRALGVGPDISATSNPQFVTVR
jgi:hypothetical protein